MVQSIKFIKNGPQAQNTSLKAQNKHQPKGPRQTPARRPTTNPSPSPSPAQLTSARRIPRGDSPAQQDRSRTTGQASYPCLLLLLGRRVWRTYLSLSRLVFMLLLYILDKLTLEEGGKICLRRLLQGRYGH